MALIMLQRADSLVLRTVAASRAAVCRAAVATRRRSMVRHRRQRRYRSRFCLAVFRWRGVRGQRTRGDVLPGGELFAGGGRPARPPAPSGFPTRSCVSGAARHAVDLGRCTCRAISRIFSARCRSREPAWPGRQEACSPASAVSRTCGDVCEHDSPALKSVKVHSLRRCFVPRLLPCGPRRRGRSVRIRKVYSFICV
jgi:hypothetical protein